MPVHNWETCKGSHKMAVGVGLLILGGVLYYTNSWALAFGTLGVLAILKGIWMHQNE